MTAIDWQYGVLTVPSRRDELLPRTLSSLQAAGFHAPRLFVDGERDASFYSHFGLEVTCRSPAILTMPNWFLALQELYFRNPNADRYALFEDDFVTYPHLKEYLDSLLLQEKTYWNLHTFPSNMEIAPKETGFFPSHQTGRSAIGLVFSHQGVIDLLSTREVMLRPLTGGEKWWKKHDGLVLEILGRIWGHTELVHNPSLTFHIGEISSMSNPVFPPALSFRGEEFDARRFLNVDSR